MTATARIGFVTVIILVGCILAIPHFRHPTKTADADAESKATETPQLTLKVAADEVGAEADTQPKPSALRDEASLEQHSLLIQTRVETTPTTVEEEEWKFPPVMPVGEEVGNRFQNTVANAAAPNRFDNEPANNQRFDAGQPRFSNDASAPRHIQPFDQRKSQQTGSFNNNFAQRQEDFRSPREQQQSVRRFVSSEQRLRSTPERTMGAVGRQSTEPIHGELAWHRIVNGDTLENLAQRYYNDPAQALMIFEANRSSLFNPAVLPIGLELKLPRLQNTSASIR